MYKNQYKKCLQDRHIDTLNKGMEKIIGYLILKKF